MHKKNQAMLGALVASGVVAHVHVGDSTAGPRRPQLLYGCKLRGNYEGHPFGKEHTDEEIERRIAYEREAEECAERAGFPIAARGHAKTRLAYVDLLAERRK